MDPPNLFFNENPVTLRYERIRTLYLDRGFKSIQDLADAVGVSRSLISLIMHGHKEPNQALKLKIAEVLKTDTSLIFEEQKR